MAVLALPMVAPARVSAPLPVRLVPGPASPLMTAPPAEMLVVLPPNTTVPSVMSPLATRLSVLMVVSVAAAAMVTLPETASICTAPARTAPSSRISPDCAVSATVPLLVRSCSVMPPVSPSRRSPLWASAFSTVAVSMLMSPPVAEEPICCASRLTPSLGSLVVSRAFSRVGVPSRMAPAVLSSVMSPPRLLRSVRVMSPLVVTAMSPLAVTEARPDCVNPPASTPSVSVATVEAPVMVTSPLVCSNATAAAVLRSPIVTLRRETMLMPVAPSPRAVLASSVIAGVSTTSAVARVPIFAADRPREPLATVRLLPASARVLRMLPALFSMMLPSAALICVRSISPEALIETEPAETRLAPACSTKRPASTVICTEPAAMAPCRNRSLTCTSSTSAVEMSTPLSTGSSEKAT